MKNIEIISIFQHITHILQMKKENLFKIRAYEKVVQILENLPVDIEKFYQEGKLEEIPGIGKGIARKIKELLQTGKLEYYEEIKKEIPEGLQELLKIPAIGPKTAFLFYHRLNISNLEELKKAALEHKICKIEGMGEKSEKNILEGIKFIEQTKGRILLQEALYFSFFIIDYLKKIFAEEKITQVGSLRRMKETVKNIDILVSTNHPEKIMNTFVKFPKVTEVLVSQETKSTVIIDKKIEVNLYVTKPENFGAALLYFTGSKPFNIKLQFLANKKGFKINEYGLFNLKTEKKIASVTEEEIFNKLNLNFIAPELREDRGEIELALENKLFQLVEINDIKGDLHLHSNWSDGINSIEELAEVAKKLRYEYIAICDHSQSLKVAAGLEEEKLLKQIAKIKEINEKNKDLKILAGSEVEIHSDGSLDYPDEVLKKLDIVIASIHTGFKQDINTMTKRLIKAMNNKYVNIIAHPTGRLLQKRQAYQVDVLTLIKEAKKTGTFLELNAFPERLDLNDFNTTVAKKENVIVAINTDSHCLSQFSYMQFGVATARRGWLESKDILNTLKFPKLIKKLKEKRET